MSKIQKQNKKAIRYKIFFVIFFFLVLFFVKLTNNITIYHSANDLCKYGIHSFNAIDRMYITVSHGKHCTCCPIERITIPIKRFSTPIPTSTTT